MTTINTRIYLRASTLTQDASRAQEKLNAFASLHHLNVVKSYVENESGSTLKRPKLFELIADSKPNDIILCESTDRLTRLNDSDWQLLKNAINEGGIKIVILDLPTSHDNITRTGTDAMTSSILKAINNMLLDIMAAMSRKDYEMRRERSEDGIKKAKAEGKYKGRPINEQRNKDATDSLKANKSWADVMRIHEMSRSQVAALARTLKATL